MMSLICKPDSSCPIPPTHLPAPPPPPPPPTPPISLYRTLLLINIRVVMVIKVKTTVQRKVSQHTNTLTTHYLKQNAHLFIFSVHGLLLSQQRVPLGQQLTTLLTQLALLLRGAGALGPESVTLRDGLVSLVDQSLLFGLEPGLLAGPQLLFFSVLPRTDNTFSLTCNYTRIPKCRTRKESVLYPNLR